MKSVCLPFWMVLWAVLAFLPGCSDDDPIPVFEEEELTGTGAEIAIGDRLYAVVGDTLKVYFYGVVTNPRSGNYILALECEKGSNYERYWRYVPTSADVGECEMNLSIYDYNGQLLDSKQVTLVTREARNPASPCHVLCLGNSLMSAGQTPIELSRRLKGTVGATSWPAPLSLDNYQLVGRKKNADGTVGWEGTVKGLVSEEANQRFEESFRQTMGRLHRFDPTDANALVMWNMANEFRMLNNMMNAITLFLWVVGIGTLTAGIVGVSNIMLITVKERTREFGIRKAIGAKPASILGLIITESILVTAVFGYLGMVAGIGLTEAVSAAMDTANAAQATGGQEANVTVFRDPTVNLSIALSATALIIFAGVLAGYFPARKAVQISAIEAMRAE